MTIYSTEFPINQRNSISDVLELALEWISGSPYTKLSSKLQQFFPVGEEKQIEAEGESVTALVVDQSTRILGGLKYIRREDGGLVWTTSIVTLKDPHEHLLSIQLNCEAINTAIRLPPPKKPYFIRQALSKLGGGRDGVIPVADKPFLLAEGEESVASALITGVAKNRLPIVYVSAGYDDRPILDPGRLAKFLSGSAHVIVEPSRKFSKILQNKVDRKNVYGGTIGIYWPFSNARKSYFLSEKAPTAKHLELDISKDIRVALSNRRINTDCSWSQLKDAHARRRFAVLKEQGSTDLNEYIAAFDAEAKAKEELIDEKNHEIARLQVEISRLTASSRTRVGGLLELGEEQAFFSDEINDIVVDALRSSLSHLAPESRRYHVVKDLVEANTISGEAQKLESELKGLLKDYTSMDARVRQALARMGFTISEDGKHYKAIYQEDDRYTFIVPKSGSDHRGGRNLASDISKKIF